MLFPADWWMPPALPTSDELTDEERSEIAALHQWLITRRTELELSLSYYLGDQVVKNLRIAVPKELEHLQTVLGWGAVAVDPYVERLAIDGFRLPGGTDVDDTVTGIWDANGMDAAQSMLFTDALSMGRGYLMVGAGLNGGAPRITVESPLNVAVDYAPDGVTPRAALAHYTEDGKQRATYMKPRLTLILEQDERGAWDLVKRENHRLDRVTIERVASRPLTHARNGRSEITLPMRSLIDNTARTLLGLVVAGEIYAAPRWAILGAVESDFVDASGNPKSGWATYITRVLGLERDEDGNLPAIHQFQAYDPSTFTKIVEMNASQFGGMAAALPQDLGLYTQGNPTTAEALDVGESRRNRRAKVRMREMETPIVRAMQHAIRYQNGGRLPVEFDRIAADWMPLREPNLAADSDGIAKQIEAQAIPATSDVTLKRLGYSAVERAQLAQDRVLGVGQRTLNAIADQGNGDTSAAG